jgi:hypothetical protein
MAARRATLDAWLKEKRKRASARSGIVVSGDRYFWKESTKKRLISLRGITKSLRRTFWPKKDYFFAGSFATRKDENERGYGLAAARVGASRGSKIHEAIGDYTTLLGIGARGTWNNKNYLVGATETWRGRHKRSAHYAAAKCAIETLQRSTLIPLETELPVTCDRQSLGVDVDENFVERAATPPNRHATSVDLVCWNRDTDAIALVEIKSSNNNAFVASKGLMRHLNMSDSQLHMAMVQLVATDMLFKDLYHWRKQTELYVLWVMSDGSESSLTRITANQRAAIKRALLEHWWESTYSPQIGKEDASSDTDAD